MRLFVDSLTNIDFSYLCPERGLVGETWLANVELIGDLDQQGMICDFGIVKKQLKQWFDKYLDHCLLVPTFCPQITVRQEGGQTSVELAKESRPCIQVEAPESAVCLIDTHAITPSLVASWCEKQLSACFARADLSISFSCEHISSPYYHYSHGLKKHNGDCQRIAHGHRSKLLIWRDSVLSEDLMAEWASRWRDIYIATEEDCIAETENSFTFSYQSNQGYFSLSLPKERCYLIDTDTTVEYIALHLANKISESYPGERIQVKAFEGIGKGAIAEKMTSDQAD